MTPTELLIAHGEISLEEREIIVSTLRSVLDSPHFRRSKRYPSFLEFVVTYALEDHVNPLKERTVGVEVFGREANYDTSTDPVVRVAAGEVRRRLAAFFSEHPEAPVRIDIPAGSYHAEFCFHPSAVGLLEEPRTPTSIHGISEPPRITMGELRADTADSPVMMPPRAQTVRRRITWQSLALAAMLLFVLAWAGWWHVQLDRSRQEFWWPLLRNNQSAIILVGNHGSPAQASTSAERPATTASIPDTPSLALDDAVVTAQICGIFRENRLACKVAPAGSTSVEDLHGKSVVLVGAFNNPWTLRLLAPLPYQFQVTAANKPVQERGRSIVEHNPTGNIPLGTIVNGDDPSAEFSKDYAIIGRFYSDITDGMTAVAAGLGLPGTSSAGEYVASQEKLHEVLSLAPKGWKGNNFEAVLEVDVVQGRSGHVKVIASRFW